MIMNRMRSRARLIALAALIGGPVARAGHPPASIDGDAVAGHLRLGLALAHALRYPEAANQFRHVLAAVPGHAIARHELALALINSGALGDAVRELEIAVACEPQSAEAHYLLALALSRSGDEAEGQNRIDAELEMSLARDPFHPGALYLSGLMQTRAGRAEAAIPRLRRLVLLTPEWPQAHYALGTALVRSGQAAEGAESLATFAKLDELQRALEQIARTIQREPRSPSHYYRAARVLMEHGKLEPARQWIARGLALESVPRDATTHDLATLMAELDQPADQHAAVPAPGERPPR